MSAKFVMCCVCLGLSFVLVSDLHKLRMCIPLPLYSYAVRIVSCVCSFVVVLHSCCIPFVEVLCSVVFVYCNVFVVCLCCLRIVGLS